jgi:hypothetical protein
MLVLGIESSCDETSASVVEDGRIIRSLVIASQTEIHARYHGVVPEVASRAHVEQILPVVRRALADAGVAPDGGRRPRLVRVPMPRATSTARRDRPPAPPGIASTAWPSPIGPA